MAKVTIPIFTDDTAKELVDAVKNSTATSERITAVEKMISDKADKSEVARYARFDGNKLVLGGTANG